jgi:RNA polymerase sigma-70 factor, ECF subfamily
MLSHRTQATPSLENFVPGASAQTARLDEASLIAQVRSGEAERFLDLIQPYERSIYLLAFSVLRNKQDAEDAAQETVFKAFQHLDQLRSETTFKSWLLQIAMNEARLRLRRDRRHLYESLDEGVQEADDGEFMPRQFADWREIPSEALEQKELRQKLQEALDSLPAHYRQAFLLRDVEHMSEKEAAEVLGITVAAVKIRLHRARLQLREQLTPVFRKRWTDRLPFLKGDKPW